MFTPEILSAELSSFLYIFIILLRRESCQVFFAFSFSSFLTFSTQLSGWNLARIKKYTEAMKYNLEHFSELMEQADVLAENKDELLKESDDLQFRLTSDLTRSPSSEEVQEIVREIYDKKFGKGASEFTACCFLAWCEQ